MRIPHRPLWPPAGPVPVLFRRRVFPSLVRARLWIYVAIAAVGWVNPGVYGSNGVYVSELYPTHLRATAVGWFFGIGRVGSFLAPAVVGFMLQYGLGAYVLDTFALTFLIASIALWMVGVETKGRVLEQINAETALA